MQFPKTLKQIYTSIQIFSPRRIHQNQKGSDSYDFDPSYTTAFSIWTATTEFIN